MKRKSSMRYGWTQGKRRAALGLGRPCAAGRGQVRGLDYLTYETIDVFHVTPLLFAMILGVMLLFYALRDLAYHVLLKARVNPRRMGSAAGGRFVYFQLLARSQRGAAKPGRAIVQTALYTSIALLVTAPVAALDFSNYVLITEHKIVKRGYGSINTDIFDFGDVVKVETMCKDCRDGRGIQKTNPKYALHFQNGDAVDLFNYLDQERRSASCCK